MRPKVFLDTTVLLTAFAAARDERPLPLAASDPETDRFTFEKCVFEGYLAFRGVGGKKPDEGRGRWAESQLKLPRDPYPLGKLASKYHGDSIQYAHFWANNIDGVHFGERGEHLDATVGELRNQRGKYVQLCTHFRSMLESQQISVLSYCAVFCPDGVAQPPRGSDVDPYTMDVLVRDTAIPSEDFEIVFAALRLGADLFVTDDRRLRKAAWSLGLNLPLGAGAFCSTADYYEALQEWRASAPAEPAA